MQGIWRGASRTCSSSFACFSRSASSLASISARLAAWAAACPSADAAEDGAASDIRGDGADGESLF